MLAKGLIYFSIVQTIFCVDHELFKLMNKQFENFENELDEFKEFSKHYYKKQEDCWYCKKVNHSEIAKEVEEFDFIIIGGGTAGSVIANRLSEIPEWRILVLESGGIETDVSTIPAMYPYLQNSHMNWGYKSIPQKTCCLGNKDGRCLLSSGKSLGGSSAINSLIYTRGNHKDYDIWADKGLTGWCWRSVFPYFQKIEDSHLSHYDRKYHRQGGPLWIENYRDQDEHLFQSILDAGQEIGLKYVDYNGKEQLGFAHPQVITKKGIRQSAAKAYLDHIQYDRKNLIIRPLCHVNKILISTHTKQAYGVEYVHDDKLFIAKATKEILLSAGSLNTPKILMLSGIGFKEDLEKHNINCMSDLKVGYNLKDQFHYQGLNYILNTSVVIEKKYHHNDEIMDYLRHGDGPLTHIEDILIGFLKTERSRQKDDHPDIEIKVIKTLFNHGYDSMQHTNIQKELYESIWKGKDGFTITVGLLHPKSTGKVFLSDNDPLRDPLIDINAFSDEDEEDLETILAGIRLVLKLTQLEPFKKLGVYLNYPQLPQCSHLKLDSDEYWKCSIKYLAFSSYRYSGSCRMGIEGDKEAVVDNLLKVFGVNGLRVVDSSIIPVTISGDMMGPTMMVAENGADIIKKEWIR